MSQVVGEGTPCLLVCWGRDENLVWPGRQMNSLARCLPCGIGDRRELYEVHCHSCCVILPVFKNIFTLLILFCRHLDVWTVILSLWTLVENPGNVERIPSRSQNLIILPTRKISLETMNFGPEGEIFKKFEYLKKQKSIFGDIKSIFHNFLCAYFRWNIK